MQMEREDVPTGDTSSAALLCRKGPLWSSDGACPCLIFMYVQCCGMSTGKCRVGGDGQLLRMWMALQDFGGRPARGRAERCGRPDEARAIAASACGRASRAHSACIRPDGCSPSAASNAFVPSLPTVREIGVTST